MGQNAPSPFTQIGPRFVTASVTGQGRPLRFALMVVGFWVVGRSLTLTFWSQDVPETGSNLRRAVVRTVAGPLNPRAPGLEDRARKVATEYDLHPSRAPSVRVYHPPPAPAPFAASPTTMPPLYPHVLRLEPRPDPPAPLALRDRQWQAWPLWLTPGGQITQLFIPDNPLHAAQARSFVALQAGRAPSLEPIQFNMASLPLSDRPAAIPPPPFIPPRASPPQGWMMSAWLFWRADRSRALATQGTLGASQAGARLDRRLAGTGRIRLYAHARVSAALKRPHDAEAAAGATLRADGEVPLSIGIERRQYFNGKRSGAFAVIMTAGIGPRPIGHGWLIEGYGQAGMVGFSQQQGFADGRIAITRPVGRGMEIGASISGGAQPGVSRLDVGPMAQMRLPLGGTNARLVAEYRHRLRGSAAPGSGLALTLAADF